MYLKKQGDQVLIFVSFTKQPCMLSVIILLLKQNIHIYRYDWSKNFLYKLKRMYLFLPIHSHSYKEQKGKIYRFFNKEATKWFLCHHFQQDQSVVLC